MSRELLLFAPPRPPLRLQEGGEVVIGRSHACEVVIASAQASRRHAAVRCQDGEARVRDLGSTNGTFVNGAPLEGQGERELAPGDRIEIGDAAITFCCVEAEPHFEGDSHETQIALRPAAGAAGAGSRALAGDLAQVPIFAVLQLLEMGNQSGCLSVDSEAGRARVFADCGRLVHAETEKERGLEAALVVATVRTGRFDFAPGEPAPERSFEASVTEVLLESSRILDEADA